MNLNKYNFFKDKIALNLLAKDVSNAKEVEKILEGNVIIGILSKDFNDKEEAIRYVKAFKKEISAVSIGLGAGDPKQWEMAAEIAAETDPGHVNQVFTTAAYTLGLLKGKGCNRTIVNALISPTGQPGKVIISTGPVSNEMEPAIVTTKVALSMMKDVGIMSVKFFNMGGLKYIDDLKEVAKTCSEVGIPIIEPTGGITLNNIAIIMRTCIDAGCERVIPHVYSAAIDQSTGLTDRVIVSKLYDEMKMVLK
ncbi:MAG: 2-dehydro-3-deoxy-phosphogluconate aldolase [Eubacteriales bacterium]